MPRCKQCKVMFKATTFLQSFCRSNDKCLSAESQFAVKKLTEKKAKDWNKEKAVRKKALMSKSDWLKLAQTVFNTYIRERDKGKPCYMCEKLINGVTHACHYMSQGNHSFLRFHEDNVWAGCYSCNVMLSGNLIEFRKVLLKTIGEERLQWLEDNRNNQKIWTIPEIEEKIKYYKEKIKELK